MAELAGVRLTDNSGNPLLDSSSAYLVDQNITVSVASSGLLYASNQNTLDDIWEWFLDKLEATEEWAELLALTPIIQAVSDKVTLLLDNWQAFAYISSPDTATFKHDVNTYTGYTINKILTDIAGIEVAAGGGLTVEEHNKLVSINPPTDVEVADAVWHAVGSVGTIDGLVGYAQRGQMVDSLFAESAFVDGYYGLRLPQTDFYRLTTGDPLYYGQAMMLYPDVESLPLPDDPDFSQWREGDTVYAFLARTQPGEGWTNIGPTGLGHDAIAWIALGGVYTGMWIRTAFAAPDVPQEIANVTNNTITVTADTNLPLWPGLTNVALGTPVALVDNLTITTPMDGVIVTVTEAPRGTSHYRLGGELLDYGSGRVAFGNDRGDLEQWQYLGFRHAIYTPHSMQRAASVHFQAIGGAVGTVTPWLKT